MQRLRNGPIPKSEIPDADFDTGIITECTKGYFRNIHKQVSSRKDPTKAQKAQERKDESRQRARRQTVTKNRRKIAARYEKDTGNLGALATIDTDFASEILSYSEGELSENTVERRDKAGVGKSANMVVGYEWRGLDVSTIFKFAEARNKLTQYLVVCCFLTFSHFKIHEVRRS